MPAPYITGQRGVMLVDAGGNPLLSTSAGANQTAANVAGLHVSTGGGGVWQPAFTPNARGDGNDGSYMLSGQAYNYNGSTYDKNRGNVDATALVSAARTASLNAGNFTNFNGRGVMVFIDMTAWTADTLTVAIQGLDPASAKWNTLLTSAALGAVAQTVLSLYPGIAAVANVSASGILPRIWRLALTHSGGTSMTYSVGYSMIV